MLRLRAGESCLALLSSRPTFAVWRLAFLNAKPAWREDDVPDAIELVRTPM